MNKLVDQSPSSRNKGNTSKVKTKTHIYPRRNRWGTVWSDTPVSGVRRNLIINYVSSDWKSTNELYKQC